MIKAFGPLILVAAVLASCGSATAPQDLPTSAPLDRVPSTTRVLPPPATAPPAVIPSLTVDEVLLDWDVATEMTAITFDREGFIAGGFAWSDQNSEIVFWSSPDGYSWERIPGEISNLGDEPHVGVRDLTTTTFGFVAVGEVGGPGDYDAAVWVSADGRHWEVAVDETGSRSGPDVQLMRSSVWFSNQVVAVGESGGTAAVWLSNDGDDWSQANVGSPLSSSREEPSSLNAVAVGGPGLIAVGWWGFDGRPGVWVSADGADWAAIDLAAVETGNLSFAGPEPSDPMNVLGVSAVASSERGYVAVGHASDGLAVWTSQDGFQWDLVESSFALAGIESNPFDYLKRPDEIRIVSLGWVGEHLAAAGRFELPPSAGMMPALSAVWLSLDDGATWEVAAEANLPATDSQLFRGPTDAFFWDSGLLLVGSADLGLGKHPDYPWTLYESIPAVWLVTADPG